MDGISTTIGTGMAGLDTELLAVVPGALAVTAVIWGVPKAVRFFKRIAG